MKSFFIKDKDYIIDEMIELSESEHNHLSKVLRMKVGEIVECYSDNDLVLKCEIASIDKKKTLLKVVDIQNATTNPKNDFTVYMAMLKGDKFEFLITKLTELGVKNLIPFESEFCIGKRNDDKEERLNQIKKDACKQCKRTKLINLGKTKSFKEMIKDIKNYDLVIFAYENEDKTSLKNLLKGIQSKAKVAIIVGSEGGFSEREVAEILDAGAKEVSLGSRILRAETACIMLSSIVLYEMDEFNL